MFHVVCKKQKVVVDGIKRSREIKQAESSDITISLPAARTRSLYTSLAQPLVSK